MEFISAIFDAVCYVIEHAPPELSATFLKTDRRDRRGSQLYGLDRLMEDVTDKNAGRKGSGEMRRSRCGNSPRIHSGKYSGGHNRPVKNKPAQASCQIERRVRKRFFIWKLNSDIRK